MEGKITPFHSLLIIKLIYYPFCKKLNSCCHKNINKIVLPLAGQHPGLFKGFENLHL
jgi:hypothetical protein